MNTTQNMKSDRELLLDFIKICFRHWHYFVISGIVCLAIGIIYAKTTKPVYEIAAQVSLRHDDSMTGSGLGRGQGGMLSMLGVGRGSDNIEDETAIMQSQGHIKEVVQALELNLFYTRLSGWFGMKKTDLYDNSPVVLSVDPLICDTLTGAVNIRLKVQKDGSATAKIEHGNKLLGDFPIQSFPATIHTAWGDFTFSPSATFSAYKKPLQLEILCANYDYAAQIYRKQFDIAYNKKSSDRIHLSLNSKNVAWGKKVLITIIDVYNRKWDADKAYGYEHTIKFIDTRLDKAKMDLNVADKSIQEFKDRYNLTEIEADVTYYFTISGELQAELLRSEAQLKMMDVVFDFIRNEQNQYSLIPFSMNENTSAAAVIEKYNEALLRRNEFYKNGSQSALAQSMDYNLDSQRKNLIQSLRNEREGMRQALDVLRKKDQELNKKLGAVPAIERDYRNLKREQELQQTVYIFLLEKREETAVRFSSLMPKLKIIDSPYVLNQPVNSGTMIIAAVSLVVAGLISLFIIFCWSPVIKLFRRNED